MKPPPWVERLELVNAIERARPLRPTLRLWTFFFLIAMIAVLLGSGIAYQRSFGVPRGVREEAAFSWGVDGASIHSPKGDWKLRVRFNDAGGMHSGNHWTWIIAKDRYGWEFVIAEGYSEPSVRSGQEPLPVRWLGDEDFEIGFVDGRHSRTYKLHRVQKGIAGR